MLSKNTLAALALAPMLAAALPAIATPRYTVTALPEGTTPAGINNAGQVVGDIYTGDRPESFVWSNGNLVRFGSLGWSYVSASAINNAGDVVGFAGLANRDVRAFTYSGGVMTALDIFGASGSTASGINDSGQVVGYYFTPTTDVRAYLYTDGVAVDLGDLGGGWSNANAVNNNGHVVGISGPGADGSTSRAFLYADGVMRDLGAFAGAITSEAIAINDAGQIAGNMQLDDGSHAFLYENGVFTDLGTLGERYSYAYDINSLGQVVGHSAQRGALDTSAYLYDGGVMIDLNTLIDGATGWTLYRASSINDLGQISAFGCRGDVCTGLLLDLATAVPEPASVALLLAGLGLLGLRRDVRRSVKTLS